MCFPAGGKEYICVKAFLHPSEERFPGVRVYGQNGPEQQQNGGEAGSGPEHGGPHRVQSLCNQESHPLFKALAKAMPTVFRLRETVAEGVQIFLCSLFEKIIHYGSTPSSSQIS